MTASPEKPHNGRIDKWWKSPVPNKGLGYLIEGCFLDHPRIANQTGHTSYIVSHDEESGEVETRNSRYTLVGPECSAPLPAGPDPKSWKMKTDSKVRSDVKAGAVVYPCAKYDYGCCSDDERVFGIECRSVTLDPNGDYPFFVVPLQDLEPIL